MSLDVYSIQHVSTLTIWRGRWTDGVVLMWVLLIGSAPACDVQYMWHSLIRRIECLRWLETPYTHRSGFISVAGSHFGLLSLYLCSTCAFGGLVICKVGKCVYCTANIPCRINPLVYVCSHVVHGRSYWLNLYIFIDLGGYISCIHTCTHTYVHILTMPHVPNVLPCTCTIHLHRSASCDIWPVHCYRPYSTSFLWIAPLLCHSCLPKWWSCASPPG